MNEYSGLIRADRGEPATTLHLVDKVGLEDWLKGQPAPAAALARAQAFKGAEGELAILGGDPPAAVIGVADSVKLGPWDLARAAAALPAGAYRLADTAPGEAALGWLLGQYRFDRYKAQAEDAPGPRVLLALVAAGIPAMIAEAEATAMVRDLVNIPAADMGPAELEAEAQAIAAEGAGEITVTRGDALQQGYPLIHAVGRAADKAFAPRLIEIAWGNPAHPRVAIIGKGVSFDSGGLDIKSASNMRLMKKDMGGAAHALALARLVMRTRLPVRLHLLVPAAENAIAGNAFRPGDIVQSRSGISVEIHNTDAEGRLILADALTRAAEEKPELIIDFATLTGAARVALGPDLPALFSDDEALAASLLAHGAVAGDPLWRLPLWPGYDEMLKSDIADIANAADSGFAGAVTAALFLRRFAPEGVAWAHLDTFAWMPSAKPGRPKGGEALGLRAVWRMLRERYGRA